MKIMVFDVPAESGGALSILNEFYLQARNYKEKDIEWVFVLSKPTLEETENIKVINLPWIKKSWFHRLYFDQFIARQLVKKYNPDKIFSLQNILIKGTNVPQHLYLHQSLPFVEYKFSFKENKLYWIYQNVLSRGMLTSVKKSYQTIVQTEWMKQAVIQQTSEKQEKISVIPPTVEVDIHEYFSPTEKNLITYFYPANSMYYKNHRLIVEAVSQAKTKLNKQFSVILTLSGNENPHIEALYKKVQEEKLPIQFVGSLSKEEVFNYYKKSVLVFPSYIETFGLPLLECKLHKGIILASNTAFSKEIVSEYPNAYFFDPFKPEELSELFIHMNINKYQLPLDTKKETEQNTLVTALLH